MIIHNLNKKTGSSHNYFDMVSLPFGVEAGSVRGSLLHLSWGKSKNSGLFIVTIKISPVLLVTCPLLVEFISP